MDVVWSDAFWEELDYELSGAGRPSREHFVELLKGAVELTLSVFWGDDTVTPMTDTDSRIRTVLTDPVPPYIFPPGAFYVVESGPNTVEVLTVEFDWDFWRRQG